MDKQTDFDNWGSCQYENERKNLSKKWESMGLLSRFTSFPQFHKKLNDFLRILSLSGWNTPNTREFLVLIKILFPTWRQNTTHEEYESNGNFLHCGVIQFLQIWTPFKPMAYGLNDRRDKTQLKIQSNACLESTISYYINPNHDSLHSFDVVTHVI